MMTLFLRFVATALILQKYHPQSVSAIGIPYGEDCNPNYKYDSNILLEVGKKFSSSGSLFSNISIFTLAEHEWTSEMEDTYMLLFLNDSNRCDFAEALECGLEHNSNNNDVNFHHHHPSHQTHEGHQLSEQRFADAPEGAAESFDYFSELAPEWRCICNQDISIHKSAALKSRSDQHPYYDDICLIRAGFPCKYKNSSSVSTDATHFFKANYACVAGASCVSLGVPKLGAKSDMKGRGAIAQKAFEKSIGYELRYDGLRDAVTHFALRHVTHVCKCISGYTLNGNGLCVIIPEEAEVWEGEGGIRNSESKKKAGTESKTLYAGIAVILFNYFM